MLKLKRLHHIAIICDDYQRSKKFYTEVMGFEVIQEVYREARDSWKLDLAFQGEYLIELFSFPNTPERPSYPEARGLRHLCFAVENIEEVIQQLNDKGVETGEIMIDPHTNKRFVFFEDPDQLPLELYEL
ncbi:VOC family protein [Flammeovirga yaeyamensis]|uniref:VOC family protein n=1 Tax=Flammeovirga yaeyamensis TaxID=367791 RepID=A0AAX1N275_9BACT|nr:VOC family protein [Flammeovirga yaeyamensis]MBB3701168.1 glyoxylase I family protein [Flammeovirga yaeyamensis]NMF38365.1 VOC family protein [Flammeovirga yaeyamensis]QWG01634.1 VOC family protein [Flammeovirga yaeyamensis]